MRKKIFAISLILLVHALILVSGDTNTESGLPLAILYDKNTYKSDANGLAHQAIEKINSEGIKWSIQTKIIDMSDSATVISEVCKQMSRGVLGIFGDLNTLTMSTLKSITDSYEIPYLTWSNTNALNIRNKRSESQVYLRPSTSPALVELVKQHHWNNTLYYVYNSQDAVYNFQSLLEYQNKEPEFMKRILLRKMTGPTDLIEVLREIDSSTDSRVIIVVDLPTKENYNTFFDQIKYLGMTKQRYNYILNTLSINELDIDEFRYGGANIFGFSLGTHKHSVDDALLHDGLIYFDSKIRPIIGNDLNSILGVRDASLRNSEIYINQDRGIKCEFNTNSQKKWALGKTVMDRLRTHNQERALEDKVYTGKLAFDFQGQRKDPVILIYKVGLNSALSKFGQYSSRVGLELESQNVDSVKSEIKKLIVIGVQDEPFLMIRETDPIRNVTFTGNDRYIGYCADLTKRLSEMLNFTYELRLVKDGKFGRKDAMGDWNGMVGELVRNEADMAIAPLTISLQRQTAIDFTMPFMRIGISIMIKKPKYEKPHIFGFILPFTVSTWMCILLGYVGVSMIFFLIGRLSPYEWRRDSTKTNPNKKFNLIDMLQLGGDIFPKSVSGNLVAYVWWFFLIIIISSYTANLGPFLATKERNLPINSFEDLAQQTDIKYGGLEGGSTVEFFRTSSSPTFRKMWEFMSRSPNAMPKTHSEGFAKVRESNGKYAFLLESSINAYNNERVPCDTMKVGGDIAVKGYGIGTPPDSPYSDSLNLAIIKLNEEGFLDELKNKWWSERSECKGPGPNSKRDRTYAFNLNDLAGVFYLFVVGLIISLVIACAEYFYKTKRGNSDDKNLEELHGKDNNNQLTSFINEL